MWPMSSSHGPSGPSRSRSAPALIKHASPLRSFNPDVPSTASLLVGSASLPQNGRTPRFTPIPIPVNVSTVLETPPPVSDTLTPQSPDVAEVQPDASTPAPSCPTSALVPPAQLAALVNPLSARSPNGLLTSSLFPEHRLLSNPGSFSAAGASFAQRSPSGTPSALFRLTSPFMQPPSPLTPQMPAGPYVMPNPGMAAGRGMPSAFSSGSSPSLIPMSLAQHAGLHRPASRSCLAPSAEAIHAAPLFAAPRTSNAPRSSSVPTAQRRVSGELREPQPFWRPAPTRAGVSPLGSAEVPRFNVGTQPLVQTPSAEMQPLIPTPSL